MLKILKAYINIYLLFFLSQSILLAAEIKSEKHVVTPQSIIQQIKVKGAESVVREMYDDGKAWNTVLSNISEGKREWIEVAKKLRPETDAGTTSELEVAMFMALEKSPEIILEASNINCDNHEEFCIDHICSSNFLIDNPLNDKSIQIIEQRKQSLKKLSIVELKTKRDRCVAKLEKEIPYIRQMLKDLNKKSH